MGNEKNRFTFKIRARDGKFLFGYRILAGYFLFRALESEMGNHNPNPDVAKISQLGFGRDFRDLIPEY